MENTILSFTIILSFVGIAVSVTALIFSIIYFIKITKLEKAQEELLKIKDISETIKKALISQCCLFDLGGNVGHSSGEEVIKEICEKYHCDEWTAISIFNSEQQKQTNQKQQPRTNNPGLNK